MIRQGGISAKQPKNNLIHPVQGYWGSWFENKGLCTGVKGTVMIKAPEGHITFLEYPPVSNNAQPHGLHDVVCRNEGAVCRSGPL